MLIKVFLCSSDSCLAYTPGHIRLEVWLSFDSPVGNISRNGVSASVNVVVLKENVPVSAKKTAFQLLHLIAGPHLYRLEFWLTGFYQ